METVFEIYSFIAVYFICFLVFLWTLLAACCVLLRAMQRSELKKGLFVVVYIFLKVVVVLVPLASKCSDL